MSSETRISTTSELSAPKSSTRPASKRLSTAPAPPKAPSKIHPTAIIANHALLTGTYPITIGAHVVVHPHAKIISTDGPVEIGEGCVIWEKAVVSAPDGNGPLDGGVVLERNCVIESNAVVSAKVLGEGSVVEGYGKVGDGAVVGKHCKISSFVSLPPNGALEDYTILYGPNLRRKDKTMMMEDGQVKEIRAKAHQKQLKGFETLIPSNIAKWQ